MFIAVQRFNHVSYLLLQAIHKRQKVSVIHDTLMALLHIDIDHSKCTYHDVSKYITVVQQTR